MLRKTIHATLIVILMMGAASAQGDQPGFYRGDGENSLRDRNLEKKNDRAIDRAYHSKQIDNDYKAATSKLPDQKANDPWTAIRPTPTAPAPKKKQQ
jgi:hypothetical protein